MDKTPLNLLCGRRDGIYKNTKTHSYIAQILENTTQGCPLCAEWAIKQKNP